MAQYHLDLRYKLQVMLITTHHRLPLSTTVYHHPLPSTTIYKPWISNGFMHLCGL